jgi:hypothetical protein
MRSVTSLMKYNDSRKLTIEDMKKLARSKGGECLSDTYINNNTKLAWKCKENHVWNAVPCHIKNGTWCPKCGLKRRVDKRRLSIYEIQNLAKSREGECLSKKYLNVETKLLWKCKYGHIWFARASHVKRGSWCPKCAGIARLTIEEMKEIAESKGGKCLSKEYVNNSTCLKWKCKEGHIWYAIPANIKKKLGRWCPICSTGISERICRKYFETIFNKKFSKSKPKWLVNSRGNLMELDGYCKELGLALEYQGKQHFIQHELFHRELSLRQRKEDDKLKSRLCKSHGVIVIQVPYTITYENMGNFIIQKCRKNGIKIPKIENIDYKMFDVFSKEKIKEMEEIAKIKGGRCLSRKYVNSHIKLEWQCKKGHIWKTDPSHIKSCGTWCPKCSQKENSDRQKLNMLGLENMKSIAKSRGGTCLSRVYAGANSKLKWSCSKGHIWFARANHVKRGSWCPWCAGSWSSAEIRYLRANWGKKLATEIAKKLRRSRSSVIHKASRFGLHSNL